MAGEQTTEEFQREDLQGKKIGAADTLQGETLAEELSQETATVYEKEGDAVNALEKGEIDIEGRIESLTYSEVKSAGKQAESLLGRLFK